MLLGHLDLQGDKHNGFESTILRAVTRDQVLSETDAANKHAKTK